MSAKLQEIRDSFEFNYTYDDEQFGGEYWQSIEELREDLEDGELDDDCDGFALYCWNECREKDIPARLVYCKTETGNGHLCCESGGWIIDNRQKWVMARDALDYEWISISGYEPGEAWHRIK